MAKAHEEARMAKAEDLGSFRIGDLSEALDGEVAALKFVDPLATDDAVRNAIVRLGRLLTFERYLDVLETRKRELGELPVAVERQAKRSFRRAEKDAASAARSVVDLAYAFEGAGVFKEMLPLVAKGLPHRVSVRQILNSALPEIQEYVLAAGMPSEEWSWVTGHVSGANVTVAGLEGKLSVEGKGQALLVGAVHPSAMPLIDGAAFVDGQLYRLFGGDRAEMKKPVPSSSLYGSALGAAHYLIKEYERRSRETERNGVVVLETGFAWWIVILIVIIVLLVVGAGITIACDNGAIKNKTVCAIGTALIFLAIAIWCIWTWVEGNPPQAQDGGIMCVMSFSSDDNPDQG